MIISHHRKFIFIKPKKVAGTSLEIALSKHCDQDDVLTPFGAEDENYRANLGYVTSRNYKKPIQDFRLKDWARLIYNRRWPRRAYNHITASEVKAFVGEEIWDTYTKISVVRNPYDYVVSLYFWRARLGPIAPFQEWLPNNSDFLSTNRRITHIDDQNQMDFMIRYEHLKDDLTHLSRLLNLTSNLFHDFENIKAKTGTRPKTKTADVMFADFPDGVQLVQRLCKDDIETYGYAQPVVEKL